MADELGGATAATIDLRRGDLGLPADRGYSAVVAALWDDRLHGLRYAQHRGLPYLSISSGLVDIAPEVVASAPDVRFDFAVGASAGRRRGGPPSFEVRIDLEGADRGGAPLRTSRHLVHPAGQLPLTATGITLGIERLLGLRGGPVAPGIHTPEALLDPAYAVDRMAESGAAFTVAPGDS
ncbi:hypothetical protein [Streptomyces arboris]|uniref:hypothetical protein n=1 Tax=Streptomyces arboris TaxID=2600619 RepID=UPI003C3097EB